MPESDPYTDKTFPLDNIYAIVKIEGEALHQKQCECGNLQQQTPHVSQSASAILVSPMCTAPILMSLKQ